MLSSELSHLFEGRFGLCIRGLQGDSADALSYEALAVELCKALCGTSDELSEVQRDIFEHP